MRYSLISVLLLALALPAVAGASPEPPEPGTPPALTGLAITNPVFLAPNTPRRTGSKLPRQTKFSFFLNENATVRVVFKQIRKGGLVKRGALNRDGFAGKNVIRFAGKTPRAKGGIQFLSAGRYRAFFTARNENGASPEASIGFRLVRPRTP
jgi:hypothetical protein